MISALAFLVSLVLCRWDLTRRISLNHLKVVANPAYLHPRIHKCHLVENPLGRLLNNAVCTGEVVVEGLTVNRLRGSYRGIGSGHNLPFCTVTCQRCVEAQGATQTAECPYRLEAGRVAPPPGGPTPLVYVSVNTTIVVIITAGRGFVHEFQAVD